MRERGRERRVMHLHHKSSSKVTRETNDYKDNSAHMKRCCTLPLVHRTLRIRKREEGMEGIGRGKREEGREK